MSETTQAILTVLDEAGRDGLKWHEIAAAIGRPMDQELCLKALQAEDLVRSEQWPEWDEASEQEVTAKAYYLTRLALPGEGGTPLVSAASERHCPSCQCAVVVDSGARGMVRIQQGILRTLRRKGPMTLAAIKREGFRAPDRASVGPALSAMVETGAVQEVSTGVWQAAQ